MDAPEARDCIVYDGVIVPPCDLLPLGRWMTPDELRELLEEYGKDDPQAGRAFLADLMLSALAAIRDGHDEPHKLAHAVLRANTADFLVSNEDASTAKTDPVTLRPKREAVRYNQLWAKKINQQGMERYLRITKVGNSRAEGYTWRESETGGRVTRILKQTIVREWTLREDPPAGAA